MDGVLDSITALDWLLREGLPLQLAEACLYAASLAEEVKRPQTIAYEPSASRALLLGLTNASEAPVIVSIFSKDAELVLQQPIPAGGTIDMSSWRCEFVRAVARWEDYRGGEVRYLWREA
jgi:hypothetical protein